MSAAAGKILDRLDRVRQTGPGRWIARCPAHEDRSPSLSIRELEDGRVLLNDFGGCEIGDVLAAIGLELVDLFPRELADRRPPSHSRIPARDLLALIDHEALTVALIAAQFLERRTLEEADWSRLATAAGRIGRARDHAGA